MLALCLIGAQIGFAPKAATAAEPPFAMNETPKPMPELPFTDSGGKALTLADFQGKVLLLNHACGSAAHRTSSG